MPRGGRSLRRRRFAGIDLTKRVPEGELCEKKGERRGTQGGEKDLGDPKGSSAGEEKKKSNKRRDNLRGGKRLGKEGRFSLKKKMDGPSHEAGSKRKSRSRGEKREMNGGSS